MRKITIVIILGLLVVAGIAKADTASVTANCALNGTKFGYEAFHDNTSIAFVQSNDPESEAIYRIEFLFKIASHTQTEGVEFRQVIAQGISLNPNPNRWACNDATYQDAFRIFHYRVYGGTADYISAWVRGDGCGDFTVPRHDNGGLISVPLADSNANGEVKICFEAGFGAASIFRLGVVDENEPCSAAIYRERVRTVNNVRVEFFRLGPAQQNFFPANPMTVYCYDEFASFRTLAP